MSLLLRLIAGTPIQSNDIYVSANIWLWKGSVAGIFLKHTKVGLTKVSSLVELGLTVSPTCNFPEQRGWTAHFSLGWIFRHFGEDPFVNYRPGGDVTQSIHTSNWRWLWFGHWWTLYSRNPGLNKVNVEIPLFLGYYILYWLYQPQVAQCPKKRGNETNCSTLPVHHSEFSWFQDSISRNVTSNFLTWRGIYRQLCCSELLIYHDISKDYHIILLYLVFSKHRTTLWIWKAFSNVWSKTCLFIHVEVYQYHQSPRNPSIWSFKQRCLCCNLQGAMHVSRRAMVTSMIFGLRQHLHQWDPMGMSAPAVHLVGTWSSEAKPSRLWKHWHLRSLTAAISEVCCVFVCAFLEEGCSHVMPRACLPQRTPQTK